jgi:hypothetical protein
VVESRADHSPPPDISVELLKEPMQQEDVILFCLICHGFMGGLDNANQAWRPDPDLGETLFGPNSVPSGHVPPRIGTISISFA